MKTAKGYMATSVGIIIGIVTVMYVGSPMKEWNFFSLLSRIFISVALFSLALILCDFGWRMYNDAIDEPKVKKIKRVPTHTNEWRDAQ